MKRETNRSQGIGYMYYTCNSAPLIIRILNAPRRNLISYTNNNTAESTTKAVCDNKYFNQLVQDAVVELTHGREYYCYSNEQITAIRVLMGKDFQIEVLNDDGIYRLYAHRGN